MDSDSKVFGFEPAPAFAKNYLKCQREYSSLPHAELFNAAVGEHAGRLRFYFDADDPASSRLTAGGNIDADVVALDEALKGRRVTFIKMDIEGAELAALKGARLIISGQKPKLAICVYHKFEDIWEIPEYIWSLAPEYSLYLRHHSPLSTETVLYAAPPD
jgi:FkbM family methyltransferase